MADSKPKKPAAKKTTKSTAKPAAKKPPAKKTPPKPAVDPATERYQQLYRLRKAIEAHDEEVAAARRGVVRANTMGSPHARRDALTPAMARLDQALAARKDARDEFLKLRS